MYGPVEKWPKVDFWEESGDCTERWEIPLGVRKRF